MNPKIVTIGVYGFSESRFFESLLDANIEAFCDLRLRRGMRGSQYAFANSTALQRRLTELGIRYLHIKELAPSNEIRKIQKDEDSALGVGKRYRRVLAERFIRAYEALYLSHFDAEKFIVNIGLNTRAIALFCVEQEPLACHRSLVSDHIKRDLGLLVEHIQP